jgi:hypothetical protein
MEESEGGCLMDIHCLTWSTYTLHNTVYVFVLVDYGKFMSSK